MTKQAAIYARISQDPTGRPAGVDRQERDCRELAARRGWEVAEVFADNDISASKGRRRPAYKAMWHAVRDGRVQVVIAWHPDRLYRRMVDLEDERRTLRRERA